MWKFDKPSSLCEKPFMEGLQSCAKCGRAMVLCELDGRTLWACAQCDTPERSCTWCKIPMTKKLVGKGKFVHYICPKCIFQHTTKYAAPTSPPT